MIPTKVASEISGYNADYLARLCREGKVDGMQVGRSWLIDRASLERFVKAQEERNLERAEKLRAARRKEYRKVSKPVISAALPGVKVPLRIPVKQAVARAHGFAHGFAGRALNAPALSTRSPRLAALAVSLAVVAGTAYASTDPRMLSFMNATPDAAVRFAFESVSRLQPPSPFRVTENDSANNAARIAQSLPRVPDSHDASRTFALLTSNSSMAALASAAALMDEGRSPMWQSDIAQTARIRMALASRIVHDPLGSLTAAYVGTGELAVNASLGIFNAYLSGVQNAGNSSLTLAAEARDGVVSLPRVSNSILDAYTNGIYAFNDAGPKLANGTVVALYNIGDGISSKTAVIAALPQAKQKQLSDKAVLAVKDIAAHAPSESRNAAGSTGIASAAAAPSASGAVESIAKPLTGGYEAAVNAEGAVIALPLKAEDTMLGIAGYASTLMDGTVSVSPASVPASASLASSWQLSFSNFFQHAGTFAQALISSGFRTLAGLFPGGNVAAPALTVLPMGPTNTISLPVSAPTITRGTSTGGAYVDNRTIVQNIVNNYGGSFVGSTFDEAVMAVVRPFVQESVDRAVMTRGGGGTGDVNSNGATLTNVTISSGNATLSNLSAASSTLGDAVATTLSAGTSTLGTTTVSGTLTVSGTITGGSLSVSSLSSNGTVIAPYFTATDTAATSTFPNLSTTQFTLGGSMFTSLLGLGLSNSAGALSVSTSSFSGSGSNFNADLLDGLDSSYFLANSFSTSSANVWLTGKSTDSLAEGITNLYFTDARARSSISVSGGGLSYASTTGVISLQQSNGSQDGYLSSVDWNTFNNKISSTSLSALYPLTYNSGSGIFGLAFGTSTSNTWGGTQTFTNAPVLGSLTGFIKASAGVLTTSLIDLSTDVSSTLPVSNGGTGSSSLTGLLKGNGTGSLLTAVDGTDYISPATYGSSFYSYLHATTTDALAEGTTNLYYTDARARAAISSSAIGLTYTTANGTFTLTNGYAIPLTASTSEWSSFFTTPSSRITAGSNLSWAGNTLNGPTDTYIRSLFSASSPISYNNGAFSFSTSSLYTGSTGQVAYFNSTNTITGSSNLYLSGSNVGIGSTSPAATLSISKSTGGDRLFELYDTYTSPSNATALIYRNSNVSSPSISNALLRLVDHQSNFPLSVESSQGASLFDVKGNGNIGIGTTTPSNKLSISTTGTGSGITIDSNGTIIGSLAQNTVGATVGLALEGVTGRQISINGTASSNVLIANGGGNVGIGTTTPTYKLTIAGSNTGGPGAAAQLAVGDGGDGTTGRMLQLGYNTTVDYGFIQPVHWGSTYTNLILNQNGGNVGIGTTSPQGKLEVNSPSQNSYFTSYSTTGYSRTFVNNDTGTGLSTTVYGSGFGGTSSLGYPNANLVQILGGTTNAFVLGTNGIQPLVFFTHSASRLTIDGSTGNVGIGTSSPFSLLSIAGNSYIGGNLTATGTIAFTNLGSGIVKSSSGTLSIATDGTDYLSPTTFDTRLAATTSLPNLTTLAGLSTVGTITSGTWQGGVIGQAYGGTGISSYSAGQVLYVDNTNTLVALPPGANGQVLKLQAGLPSWGVDETIGAGGSDGIFATSTGRIYPLDTSQTLLVGTNATSTKNSIFEVNGQAYISSKLGIATTSASVQLSVGGAGLISGTLTAGNIIDTGLSANALVYSNSSNQLATTTITGPLTFSAGTLGIQQANGSQDGYISSSDWNTFNNKVSSTSLSALYPLTYNSGTGVFNLAFGTTTANSWSALQTFNGGITASALTLGSVNGVLYGASGTISSTATSSAILNLGLTGTLTTLGASDSLSIATSSLYTGTAGQFPYFSGTNTLTGTSSLFVDTTGYIGIGSTSPSQLLSVSGNAYITGTAMIGTLNGLIKGTNGVLSAAISGTDYAPATTGTSILYGNGFGGFSNATVSAPLTFTGGALGIQQANGSQDGYLSASDWNTFNSKQAALTFTYPLVNTANTISLAFGTTTANSWSALQTFNGGISASALTLGSVNGVLYGANGSVSSVATSSATLGLGLSGSLIGVGGAQSLSIATSSLYTGTAGQFPYFSGTNTLTGTSSLFLATSGNVGINTVVPGTNLSIVQSTAGTAGLTIATPSSGAGYAAGAALQFNYSSGTQQTTRIARIVGVTESGGGGDLFFDNAPTASGNWQTNMVILRAGNVGVGTTSPWGQLSASSTASFPTLAIKQLGSGPAAIFEGGNVGIGTTSPGGALEVASGQILTTNGSASAPGFAFSNSPNTGLAYNSPNIIFYQGGNNRMQLSSALSMFVTTQSGSSANGFALAVGSSLSSTAPIIIPNRSDLTTGFGSGTTGNINAIVGGTEITRWTSTGFGIGTTSPFSTLSVNGSTFLSGNLTATGTIAFTGLSSGLVKSTSGTLSIAVSGTDYAPATTGSSILYGNGSGGFSLATVSSPLTFTGGVLGIQVANSGQPGYLTSSDWTTFNNKVSSTSLSATYPLSYNSSSGVFSFAAATSSATLNLGLTGTLTTLGPSDSLSIATSSLYTGTAGQFPYFSGTNTLTATSTLFVSSASRIGIGTNNPSQLLDVAGSINIANNSGYQSRNAANSSDYTILTLGGADDVFLGNTNARNLLLKSGSTGVLTFSIGSTEYARFSNTGTFGIGTTSPSQPLSVSGNSLLGGNLTVTGTATIGTLNGLVKGTNGVLSAAISGTDYAPATTGSSILAGNGSGGFSAVSISSPLTFSGGLLGIQVANSTQPGYLSSTDWTTFNNKVSSTSLSALYPLSYNSSSGVFSFAAATSSATLNLGLTGTLTTLGPSDSLSIATSSLYTGTAGQFPVFTGTNSIAGTSNIFMSGSNIGIGTTTPSAKLMVMGNGTNPAIRVDGSAGTGLELDYFSHGGSFYSSYYATFGHMGGAGGVGLIGGLQIVNQSPALNGSQDIVFANQLGTNAAIARMIIDGLGNVGIGAATSSITARLTVQGPDTSAASHALEVTNSASTTLFLVNDAGNVGIGTTSPYASLALGGGNLVLGAASAGGTSGDLYLPKLGVSTGSFIAVDASGKIIATTSPLSTLVANYPITGNGTSGSPLTLAFGTTTANSWSALQTFNGGITTSGTVTLGSLSGLLKASSGVVSVAVSGTDYAPATTGTSLLAGNGSGGFATVGISSPLTYTGGFLGIQVANGSQPGYLSSTDWTTFNSKQAALTFTYPLVNTSNTISLAFGTTTANTWGPLQTFTNGVNTSGTTGGYYIDGNLILQASSTNASTLVGNGAGANLLAGDLNNTAVGQFALQYATSTFYNTAVGYGTLQGTSASGASGGFNSAFGYKALNANTTGQGNTGVGYGALLVNTTGSYNSVLGRQALYNNTSGTTNVAIGGFALTANVTGSNNVAVGYDSLFNATSTNGNTAVGYFTLVNTTGAANVGLGAFALNANTTGSSNVGIGYQNLYNNASATSTVAVGYLAAFGNGSYANQGVTVVGNQAGRNFQTGSDYNTLVGYRAGYDITTGASNIILGKQLTTNTSITTGSGNILIGDSVYNGLSATGSNQLNIGNLIFGTGLAAQNTLSTGTIGISTSSPWGQFSINSLAGLPAFVIGSSTTQFIVDKNGNVGVGTTSPSANLSIAGTGYVTNGFGIGYANPSTGTLNIQGITSPGVSVQYSSSRATGLFEGSSNAVFAFTNTGGFQIQSLPLSSIFPNPSTNGNDGVFFVNNDGGVSIGTYASTAGAGPYDVANGLLVPGNVGIGTTSPGSALSVAGNAYLAGNLTATGTIAFTGLSSGLVKSTSGTLSIAVSGTDYAPATTGSSILAGNGSGGFATVGISSPLTYVGGFLGIQVANSTQPGYLSSTDWTTFNNKVSSTSLSALYPLSYNSSSGVFSFAAATSSATLNLGLTGTLTTLGPSDSLSIATSSLYTGTAGQFPVFTGTNSIAGTSNIFMSGSNIGIGTTSPTNKLEVNGSTYLGGTLNVTDTATFSKIPATAGAATLFSSGTGTIAAMFGSGSMTGASADSYGGAVRFNGQGVAWGDLSFYPAGGGETSMGNFRFSTTGNNLSTTPVGKLGVGQLYINAGPGQSALIVGSTTSEFKIDKFGNVGIGTSSPSQPLSVSGNSLLGGSLTVTGNTTLGSLSGVLYGVSGAVNSVSTSTPTLGLGLTGTLTTLGSSDSLSIATSSLYAGTTGKFPYFSGTNTLTATSSLFLDVTGNVGIGSTSPGLSRLVIQSDGSVNNTVLTVTGKGFAGGQVGPFYGIYETATANNNATASYGIYVNNPYAAAVVGPSYGTYSAATQNSSTRLGVGVEGDVFVNSGAVNNGPTLTTPVAGVMAIASTTGTSMNAVTTALLARNQSQFGSLSYGAYIDAVAGPTTVVPLRVDYNTSEVLRVTSNGYLSLGTTTPDQNITIYGASKPGLEFSVGGGANKQWNVGIDTSDSNKLKISNSSAPGTNDYLTLTTGGSIGIGTTNPNSKLEVQGTGTGSTPLKIDENGGTSGNFAVTFNSNNAPEAQVNLKSGASTGYFTVNDTGKLAQLGQTFANGFNLSASSSVQIGIDSNNIGTGIFEIAKGNGFNGRAGTDGTSLFKILNSGNVGIGTTSPSQTLSVAGNSLLGGNLTVTGTATIGSLSGLVKATAGVLSAAVSGTDYAPATSGSSLLAGNGSGGFQNITLGLGLSYASPNLTIATSSLYTGTAGQFPVFTGTNSIAGTSNIFMSGSNIGIGTTTPSNKLSISTSGTGSGITIDSNGTIIGSLAQNTVGATVGLALEGVTGRQISINGTASSNVLIANGGGQVAIGTTTPSLGSKLEISGTQNSIGQTVYTNGITTAISNLSSTDNTFGRLAFRTADLTNGNATSSAEVLGVTTSHAAGGVSGALQFMVNNAGSLTAAAGVTPAGLNGVGINLSGTQYSLSGRTGEMEFAVNFPDATANQKFDIYFTGTQQFWGNIEVDMSASWATANASGEVKKVYSVGMSPGGSPFLQNSRYAEAFGSTPTNFAISDFSWDATNSRYKLTIAHLKSTGNTVYVKITAFADTSAYLNNFMTLQAGSVYTTDPTVYATPQVNFVGNIGFGTTTPYAPLSVWGSGTTASTRAFEVANNASTTLFLINNAGNVAIGTTTADQNLSIYGASKPSLELSTGAGANNQWNFGIDTSDSNKLKISNSTGPGTNDYLTLTTGGAVGIGTTSPQGKLEVNSSNQDTYLTSYSSAGYSRLFLYNNANTGIIPLVYGSAVGGTSPWGYSNANLATIQSTAANAFVIGTTANQPLSFIAGNAQRLTILGNGNVGIGTTSSAATLGVSQSTSGDRLFELYDTYTSPSKSVALIYRNSNVSGGGSTSNALLRLVDNAINYPLSVESSTGTSLFDVYGNGNVGISSSSPYAQLSLNSLPGLPAMVVGSTTTQFIIDQFGNVGIGTSSPSAQLALGGGNLVLGAASAGGTPGDLFLPKLGTPAGTILAVDASGKVIATTTSAGGVSSVNATYPVLTTGGANPTISLDFSTTTANTWSANNIFTANVGVGTTTPAKNLSIGGNVIIGAASAGGTNGTLTYGGVTLANTVTGTGSMVLSASPTFSGTVTSPTITLSGTTGTDLTATALTSGTGLNATMTTSGIAVKVNSTAAGLTSASALTVTGTSATMTAGYTGAWVNITPTRLLTAVGPITESGNMIAATPTYSITGSAASVLNVTGTSTNLTRTGSDTSSSASSQLNFSGPLVSLASNMSCTTGTCTDSSNLLSISQLYANATGAVVNVSNSGTGPLAIFNGNGNFGIGTTTPFAQLSINSNGISGPSFVIGSSTATNFVVANGGNVGIGTTSPAAQLTTTGTVQFANFGAGTLQTDSSGNITVSSDERLKNVTGNFTRSLSDIEKLNPVLFHWNAISGLNQNDLNAGFLAQNVQQAIPEAVGIDNRGYLTLQDRPILAASVNAIKELASTTIQLSLATSSLNVQISDLASAFASSSQQASLPHSLTATSITADSLALTSSIQAAGTVTANQYVVPQNATTFTFGSTTVNTTYDPSVLTDTGSVDIYKLASYAVAAAQNLASRTDLLSVKIDDLETRVAALEALNSATTTATTTSTSSTGFLSTLQSTLQGIGIILQKGYLALDSLVTHQLFLVQGQDGTSSTGSEIIPAGATTLNVTNPLVHTSSKIFLTFTSSVDGSWYLSKKQEGSFTITLEKAQPADTEFDYFIIQTDPNAQVASVGATTQPAGATEAPSAPAPITVSGGPVVTLSGDAAMQIAQGATWTDPGATAKAADGTDLTSSITETGSVDANTAGTYTLTYSVVDSTGKTGQASRVVTVLAPTTAPSSGTTVTQAPSGTSSSGGTASSTAPTSSGGTTGSTSSGTTASSGTTSGSGTTSSGSDTTGTASTGSGTTASSGTTSGSGTTSSGSGTTVSSATASSSPAS